MKKAIALLIVCSSLLTACKSDEDVALQLWRDTNEKLSPFLNAGLESVTVDGEPRSGPSTLVFPNERSAAEAIQAALDANKAALIPSIQKHISEDCHINDIEITCAWIAANGLSEEVTNHLSKISALRRRVALKNSEFIPEQGYKVFQNLSIAEARQHAIRQLAQSPDVHSRIIANLLSMGSYKACREIERLSNEFEKEDAYAALIDVSTLPTTSNSHIGKPYKATSVISTGDYDKEQAHFSGSREILFADYEQQNRIWIRDKATGVGKLKAEIEVSSCLTQPLQAFHFEKTGKRENFPKKIRVFYKFSNAQNLLSADIPADESAARQIVSKFNNPPRSVDVQIEKDRPMFVIFTFEPAYNNHTGINEKGTELDIEVHVTDVAFYPLIKPTEYKQLLGGVDLGFPKGMYFEGTKFPSVDPLYHYAPRAR